MRTGVSPAGTPWAEPAIMTVSDKLAPWTYEEIVRWLIDRCGSDGDSWMEFGGRFYFANPQDHLVFCLRWS